MKLATDIPIWILPKNAYLVALSARVGRKSASAFRRSALIAAARVADSRPFHRSYHARQVAECAGAFPPL